MRTKQPTAEGVADYPQHYYAKLNRIDLSGKIEKKAGLDYLSWANAWNLLKHEHPTAQRIIYESPVTGFNYFTDGKTAYVKVGIIVDGLEHIDMLPIMDYRNNSIPLEKLTSSDVNKAIQRSTAKAIAMHGLGIQLWTGEDTQPPQDVTPKQSATKQSLAPGDKNWEKVQAYVSMNKMSMTFESILSNLKTKYNVNKEIEATLNGIYTDAD